MSTRYLHFSCRYCPEKWNVPIGKDDHKRGDSAVKTMCLDCAEQLRRRMLNTLGKRTPEAATVVQ